MARTKASVGSKVSSFKSSKARCSVAPTPSTSVSAGGSERQARNATGGGNSVCQRETPKWQKPITTFFICKNGESKEDNEAENIEAGTSSKRSRRAIIESDDEDVATKSDNRNIAPESDNDNNDPESDNGNAPDSDNEGVAQESDDVNVDTEVEKPKNTVLDESIELQPLTGENSHKIEEYYSSGGKGKGVGKKSKGKENRRDRKRGRDDDVESVSKKIRTDEE